jgi:hypothetical protein
LVSLLKSKFIEPKFSKYDKIKWDSVFLLGYQTINPKVTDSNPIMREIFAFVIRLKVIFKNLLIMFNSVLFLSQSDQIILIIVFAIFQNWFSIRSIDCKNVCPIRKLYFIRKFRGYKSWDKFYSSISTEITFYWDMSVFLSSIISETN